MKVHGIELYRPEMIESRMKYIHENPVKAGNYLSTFCVVKDEIIRVVFSLKSIA